jgi:hypothetical protein
MEGRSTSRMWLQFHRLSRRCLRSSREKDRWELPWAHML